MSRGLNNLDYKIGFRHEAESFIKYKSLIKFILNATQLEPTSRTIVDLATGTDAYAEIQGKIYGISLRVREKDFNSFTLSRHINDKHSEIHKWCKRRTTNIKPAYHIQISKINKSYVKLIRINIDAFAVYLQMLIRDNELEKYYSPTLLAYEFPINEFTDFDAFFTDVYSIPFTENKFCK